MLRLRTLAPALLLAVATVGRTECGEILDQVPRDALGLVVVRNLAETDSNAGLVLSAIGSKLPGPLALLKSIAGIQAGLDESRELMIVLLPSAAGESEFSLALWLPVADYAALVHSLDGDPGRRIGAVTLAGEDLLVAREQDWAVIMDPDQRDRLEMLRESAPEPPADVGAWAAWVATNDASAIILAPGMRTLSKLAEREQLFEPLTPPPANQGQNLLRPAPPPPLSAGAWSTLRSWIRASIGDRPELARWAGEANGAALGLRLTPQGDAVLGAKLVFSEGALPASASDSGTKAAAQAPPIFSAGDFVVAGAGRASPNWLVPAVAPYVRQVATDLTNNYGIPVTEQDVARFRAAAERAIAEVRAFSVLTRPGTDKDAIFTNNFLALRVTRAQQFLDIAAECVDVWNDLIEKPNVALKLKFTPRTLTVGTRSGMEYSIDMAAAVNAPAIPEARASMEKLFGPGALFRLQMMSLDDETVLLAAATEEQVAEIIAHMGAAHTNLEGYVERGDSLRLLSSDRDWCLCLSPSGYTSWHRRQMDAVLGAVIGGPIVPLFPTAPPVVFAGKAQPNSIWLEAAVPIETSRAAGQFWRQR